MKTETFQKIFLVSVSILLLFLIFITGYVYVNKAMFLENPLVRGIDARFPEGDAFCICTHVLEEGGVEVIKANQTNAWYGSQDFIG